MSWLEFGNHAARPEQVRAFASALEAHHAFNDALAAATPGPEFLEDLARDLRRWTDTLALMAVGESKRLAGRLPSLPSRGHLTIPPFDVNSTAEDDMFIGTVVFGLAYYGGGTAVGGGAIMTIFDEALGAQSSAGGRKAARTAYLKTDFRAIVPMETPIRVRAWFEREEGRKRYIRGDMWAGDVLCAEAEGLFIELREGLPEQLG